MPRSELWSHEWGQDVIALEITRDKLEEDPEYVLGILNYALKERLRRDPDAGDLVVSLRNSLVSLVSRRYDYISLRKECYRQLIFKWFYGEQFDRRNRALLKEKVPLRDASWPDESFWGDNLSMGPCYQPSECDRLFRRQQWTKVTSQRAGRVVLLTIKRHGKPGCPVTPMRRAAIKALVLLVYLKHSWREITRKVCPCGDPHLDWNRVDARCQPKLEAQVRLLKRLLRDCNIELSGAFPASAIMPNGLSEPKKGSLKTAAPTAITQTQHRIEELKRQLTELGPMHPGNLSEQQYKVCDTPGCRCKDSRAPRKHGPYHVLSFKLGDKSSSYVVRPEQAEEMRVKLVNFERFRELTSEWVKLAVELERAEREQAKHD